MRRALFPLLIAVCVLPSTAWAQYGPVGFVNCNDGVNGITGGSPGEVVRVRTREELARYASSDRPCTVIVEGRLEGDGLNRRKDVIEVNSDKTIVGVKGAELAGIGLNISGKSNIIIRNLIIHHADPDGIAARNSHHIWVDHCDIYSRDEPDREDWDGLIDLTVGSSYLTVSYCHIHDHHKACLLNSGTMHREDNGRNRATYHHNAFVRTDQRNPRIGYGLGHVFCNLYEDIGNYAIGMHTQARVLSEHNYFGPGVKRPFSQMYATSTDDASCAFFDDRGSHFSRPLPQGFKYRPTGTDFEPALWYDYRFALDDTSAVRELFPNQTGPQEGLEHEPLLWPGNGAVGLTTDIRPFFSRIENQVSATVFWGSSPDRLRPVSLDTIRLLPATTYWWKVRAVNPDGVHISPLYRFTTASAKASQPAPADGEQNAQLRAAAPGDGPTVPMILRWQPAAKARSYKVWLWPADNETDLRLVAITTETSCTPGSLRYGQTYCWRADVVTSDGETLEGDVWTFSAPARPVGPGRTEAEHLARSAYAYLERQDGSWFRAGNDSVTVGEAGPGSLTGVWNGPGGSYRISIDYYDEKSGQASFWFYINDREVDFWTGERQNGMKTRIAGENIPLNTGDQLRLDFCTQGKMRCRIDGIFVGRGDKKPQL